MKNLVILSITSFFCVTTGMTPQHQWLGRAVPMAFNKATGEWSVLFRLNPATGFWEDFAMPGNAGERGDIPAARALKNQTNGKYTPSMQGVPSFKTTKNDFVYFVPVTYISGRDLYGSTRNQFASDFAWIPAREIILSNGDVQRPHNGRQTNVNRGVLAMLRNYLDIAIHDLTLSRPSKPSQAPSQPLLPAAGKLSPAAASSWLNHAGAIYFYEERNRYYEFTNFYASPINLGGKNWKTTEHYFQAQKFAGTPIEELIRALPTPRAALDESRKMHGKYQVRIDWQQVKTNIMLDAVRAKMEQHPHIAKLLLDTGNAIIVEAAPKDEYWGYGANGKGVNALGQILMHVRKELRSGQRLPFVLYNSPQEYFAAHP